MRAPIQRTFGAFLAAVGLLLAALACGRAPVSPHVSLDATLGALRTQFNAETDRVRVLMIVAPT